MRARLWIGLPLLLGLLGALIASHLQAEIWRSQAGVSFNLANLPIAASGSPTSLASVSSLWGPRVYLEAQAKIARSPELAARVVQAAGVPGISARRFLRHSSAKPESDADILALSVTYRSGAAAVRLANAYATEFRRYKHQLDMRSVTEALRKIEGRYKELLARGLGGSDAYRALVQMRARLRSIGGQMLNTMSVQRADGAASFRPHAFRNGLIGGAIGALLGVVVVLGVRRQTRAGRQSAQS